MKRTLEQGYNTLQCTLSNGLIEHFCGLRKIFQFNILQGYYYTSLLLIKYLKDCLLNLHHNYS